MCCPQNHTPGPNLIYLKIIAMFLNTTISEQGRIPSPSPTFRFARSRSKSTVSLRSNGLPTIFTNSTATDSTVTTERDLELGSTAVTVADKIATDPAADAHPRTRCGWIQTAGLLLSEYICLAILSFPWSYSVLGLIPGILITVVIALLSFYTGTVVGDFCTAYPAVRDVCDIGKHIFWNKRWAYIATMVCYLLNTFFVQGMHVLVGATFLNTVTDNAMCTVSFTAFAAVACFLLAIPRQLSQLGGIGLFSAASQFVAVTLCIVFICTQSNPAGYNASDPVSWSLWPRNYTTFTQAMSAIMNIVFMFTGHICYPHFIMEMKKPRDFRKSLTVLVIAQLLIFITTGVVILTQIGDNYMANPAFGAISDKTLKTVAFFFSLLTIIFLGSLFGNMSSKFIFIRIFKDEKNTKHREGNTLTGWCLWLAISACTWIIGFLIAELIPIFSELLSLMSALFQGWFSFVFWGGAFLRLKQSKYDTRDFKRLWTAMTLGEKWLSMLNVLVIVVGLFFFGPGTYASIQEIREAFDKETVGGVFSCDFTSL